MVDAITDQNFEEETKDGVVLTDFWATWCGPCKMQSPVIDQLAEERQDVKFTKMDVDHNQETAKNLGIIDRKSTRLNSSHVASSYAVFCLKKKSNSTAQGLG